MKRFLSIILVLAMCLATGVCVLPAGAEETGNVVYLFAGTEIDKTNGETWLYASGDKKFGSWSLQNAYAYGDHGFKYWTADAQTEALAPKNARALQVMDGATRLYTIYGDNGEAVPGGIKLVVALKAPAAGFYKVAINSDTNNTSTAAEFYMRELDETNKDIAYYTAEETQIGNTYSIANHKNITLSEIIYNSGEKDLAIGLFTGEGKNMQLDGVTLIPVTATAIELSSDKTCILSGESAKVSVKATLSDDTETGVVDSFVTYESSDKNIATVSADGTVNAVGNGEVTITATVGGLSSSVKLTVGAKIYSFIRPTLAASDWDSTLTSKNMQSTIVPLIGYGSHDYKYWDVDDAALGFVATNVRILQYYAGGLRVWSCGNQEGEEFENPEGTKLALALRTPKSGFYEISHDSASSDGQIADLRVYMSHISAEDEAAETRRQVEEFMRPENLVKMGESSNTGSHSYNKVVALNGTDNIIWTVSVDPASAFSLGKIKLKEMEVSGITLSSDKEEIEIGETAKLSAFADGKEIAPGFVKFESLTSNIATVAIDGTVTPLAEGEAEFKVTALDLTATVKINVKAKSTVEEIVEGVALGILTNYREAAGGVAAEGYIINEKATVDVGTTIAATASDVGGYKFVYWKDGSRFLSSERSITYTVARNTALTAVYDVVSESEAGKKTVEFWNADKTLISRVETEADTVALPENDPTMTGYHFIGWYTDENTPFTAETVLTADVTRVVAQYELLDTEYTVTVDGDEKVRKYDAVVEKTAGDNFTYWTLNDVVMSFKKSLRFITYGNATIKTETADMEIAPTVVLDKKGESFFLTYETPDGFVRIEAGIIFGPTKDIEVNGCYSKASAKNKADFGQFTAKPMDTETYARGYQIFKKDGKVLVVYTDAISVE
ncbi:MAG: hypothetical protein E7473_08415 [Ruminococcaceae bacterium]|nr:hypothetical protein [Oscillospiraceae bacterium]